MIDGCFVVPDDVQEALAVVLERQFQLGLTVAKCGRKMTDDDYKPAADALRELMRAIDAAMCGKPANAKLTGQGGA